MEISCGSCGGSVDVSDRWHRPGSRSRGVEVDRDLRRGGRPALAEQTLHCATCGAELDGDPDEDPTGDARRPICGECERNRDFLAARLAELPAELARETEAIRLRYADPQPRLFPVAVTFLVPEGLA